MKTNSQSNLNFDYYNKLPKSYYSFNRPEWEKPFMIKSNDKLIDLNSGNILNFLYSNLSSFSVKIDKVDHAPVYLGVLQSFVEVAQNQRINLIGKDVDFFGDEWNFIELRMRTQASTHFVFNLKNATQGLSDYYNIVLRLLLYYAISDKGINHTSTYGTFNMIKNFVREIFKIRVYNLRNLNRSDIEKYIEQQEWAYSSQAKAKTAIKYFLSVYSFLVEDIYTKDINEYLSDINRQKIKAIIEENKTPLLSTEAFQRIEIALQVVLKSETNPLKDRLTAGLALVCMQTGLRRSELVVLEKSSLVIEKVGDKILGRLSYYSAKTHHKQENIITTIATPIAIAVINEMIKIDKDNKSKYLAFDDNGMPMTSDKLNSNFINLIFDNSLEMGLINNTHSSQFHKTIKIKDAVKQVCRKIKQPSKISIDDLISFPTFTQFRVYFASDLKARGVDDRRISLLLGHSSKDMFGYYVRGAGEIQEEKQAIEQLIYEIADNKVNLLGPKGNEFESRIKNFIEKNSFNVKENLGQIIDGIINESELRIKLGGFCIHSNKRRTCHFDTSTDEFLCAYGCCPNHCHTYYSAPITYSKFKDIIMAVSYNQEKDYVQQTEKEIKKLKAVIVNELKPEIEDLRYQLTKQSAEEIIGRHPDTEIIISNIIEITLEIESWLININNFERKIKGNM